jgi:hypothetical protein
MFYLQVNLFKKIYIRNCTKTKKSSTHVVRSKMKYSWTKRKYSNHISHVQHINVITWVQVRVLNGWFSHWLIGSMVDCQFKKMSFYGLLPKCFVQSNFNKSKTVRSNEICTFRFFKWLQLLLPLPKLLP